MIDDTSTGPSARLGVRLTALFLVLLVLWELVRSRVGFASLGDAMVALIGSAVALGLAFSGQRWPWSRHPRASAASGLAPILLGSAIVFMVLSQGIWDYLWRRSGQTMIYPSWADVFFLGSYPFLVAGIILLPARPQHPVVRTRLALDALTMMVAAVTVSWYFLLGPLVLQAGKSAFTSIVSLLHPEADLLVLICLLLILTRIDDPGLRWATRVLGAALALVIFADTNYFLRIMQGPFVINQVQGALWPVIYVLIGLAAYLVRRRPIQVFPDLSVASELPEGRLWRTFVPYAPAPFVIGLLAYAWDVQVAPPLFAGVLGGSVCLLGLILLRQVLVLLENHRLYVRLNAAYRMMSETQEELRASNQALTSVNARLEALSTTDPLTNLPNHRAIVSAIARELERARRYRRPCALLFIDVDHFKALNDTYGHPVGDTTLSEFGEVVAHTLRGVDTLGRWGGEEFVAILPEMDAAAALSVAERVRDRVASHAYGVGAGHLTCSIGVATYPDHAENREGLIASADRAMYAAKRLGRNQVRAANDPAIQALLDAENAVGSREESALIGTVEALAALVQARDPYAGAHMQRVAAITLEIALILRLDKGEARPVILAAELHDIGNVAIPDAMLRKPASLTSEEWGMIHTHPGVGADVVNHVPALRGIAPTIRAHHERWDGKGYPDGLAGEAIPRGARIIAVADAYDAMISDRSYQMAYSPSDALAELRRCAGSQFDPAIVDAIVRVMARPGSNWPGRPTEHSAAA